MPTEGSPGLEEQARPSCALVPSVGQCREGRGSHGATAALVPLLGQQEPAEPRPHACVTGALLPPPRSMEMEALSFSSALCEVWEPPAPVRGTGWLSLRQNRGCHPTGASKPTSLHSGWPHRISWDPQLRLGALVWQGASCKTHGLILVPQTDSRVFPWAGPGRHEEQLNNLPEMLLQL